MPVDLWIFLFGLVVFGLLMLGVFFLYVEALEEELESEGREIPSWAKRLLRLFGARPSSAKPDPSPPPASARRR